MLDALYTLISMARLTSFTPTVVKYAGYRLQVPSNIVMMLRLASQVTNLISTLYVILASPARALEEELVLGRELAGPLHLPLTVQLRGRGLQAVAYKRRTLTLTSPENILLKLFLLRLATDAERLLEELERLRRGKSLLMEAILERLRRQLEQLARRIRLLLETPLMREIHVGPLAPDDATLLKYSKVVLRRGKRRYRKLAIMAQSYVSRGLDIRLIQQDMLASEQIAVSIEAYKLYEVFTFYVTALALLDALPGPTWVTVTESSINVAVPGRIYRVLYDEPIPQMSWLHSGTVRYNGAERGRIPPGRPDVTLAVETRPLMVLDAKYTKDYAYLSQARYKILGYLNEYNVKIGAIAYDPTRLKDTKIVEEEDREFMATLKEVTSRGGAVIEDEEAHIYLLPLKPSTWNEVRSNRAYSLTVAMLREAMSNISSN